MTIHSRADRLWTIPLPHSLVHAILSFAAEALGTLSTQHTQPTCVINKSTLPNNSCPPTTRVGHIVARFDRANTKAITLAFSSSQDSGHGCWYHQDLLQANSRYIY